MQTPVQITFRGMAPSEAVDLIIRQRVEWLEAFHDHITRCHVVVEAPQRHHHKGRVYSMRIDITTPTGEVVASSREPDGGGQDDIHAVIRDVFATARRQLEDDLRKRQAI